MVAVSIFFFMSVFVSVFVLAHRGRRGEKSQIGIDCIDFHPRATIDDIDIRSEIKRCGVVREVVEDQILEEWNRKRIREAALLLHP